MNRCLLVAAVAVILCAGPASAAGLTGKYIEARTCDVWTGPCYANAEMELTGKHAVMCWSIDKGSFDKVNLDGLGIAAVVVAHDTLGCKQTGKAKAVLIVDSRANKTQREALIRLAKQQGGDLVANIVHIESDSIDLNICPCKENGCAILKAGKAKIETRCLNAAHDKVCGNETAFYPPLCKGVKVLPAMAVENSYKGKGVGSRWSEVNRRGAYLGSFEVR